MTEKAGLILRHQCDFHNVKLGKFTSLFSGYGEPVVHYVYNNKRIHTFQYPLPGDVTILLLV